MDFLYNREGGIVFYLFFHLSPFQCTVTKLEKYLRGCKKCVRGCVSLKKYVRGCVCLKKTQGKVVEVTVNSKEENSSLLSGFCPRIRHL